MIGMEKILVSVIIPTYSRNETLCRAIDSILAQTHKNLDIIVVDDNPADSEWRVSTENLMQKYSEEKRIRYIKNHKNLGGAGARNEGIKAAKGEYIAFLDDDDEYFPAKIEKQLNLFLSSDLKKLALVFCDTVMTYDSDKVICYQKPRYKGCCLYEAMRDNCISATSQWLVKKSALEDVGMFSIVPCKQDSTVILKLLIKGYEVDGVPEVLSKNCNYQGVRISGGTPKNLQGELMYRDLCRTQYDKLTKKQQDEVEYQFNIILRGKYKAVGDKKSSRKTYRLMLKKHPFRTVKNGIRDKLRYMKNKLTGGVEHSHKCNDEHNTCKEQKNNGGGNKCNRSNNVLHIANYCAIYRGNFIESLDNLSSHVKECGGESIYMFPQDAENIDWVKELQNRGRKVYFFTGKIFKDKKSIKKIIKEHKITIIHTHFLPINTVISALLAKSKNIKVVVHFHNHSIQQQGIKNKIRQRIYKNCFMVSCSESVGKSIEKCFPKNKRYVIDNGVYFDRLENVPVADRKEYGVAPTSKICLIFGFDFYRKGVDVALKALNKLNKSEIRYELLISLSKNFEFVEQETVKILGSVPEWVHIIKARNDIAALYNMCDLFLSPSREEGLPYSVLEAAYCNCNVVMSDIDPQKNLKIPYGVFFKGEDIDGLVDAIGQACELREEKLLDYTNVQLEMRKNYSLDQWTSNILEVYSDG